MNDMKDTVMQKISRGELTMRPRWYFALLSALATAALFLLALWLVYLESFIIFLVQGTGLAYVPSFGVHGVLVFLYSLPWLLVFLTVGFLGLTHWFLQRYAFCYTRPVMFSIIGLIGFSMLGAFLLARSELHYAAMERATDRGLPIFGVVYKEYGLVPQKAVHVGTIRATTSSGFILESRTGDVYQILVQSHTRVPHEVLQLGETVLILGTNQAGTIEARGVRGFDIRHIKHRLPQPE